LAESIQPPAGAGGFLQRGNVKFTGKNLNWTIEKNIGHIFVVSRKLLAEYLALVEDFYQEPSLTQPVSLNKKKQPPPDAVSNIVDIKKLKMRK
jgi:hypothetical protein